MTVIETDAAQVVEEEPAQVGGEEHGELVCVADCAFDGFPVEVFPILIILGLAFGLAAVFWRRRRRG